MSNIFSQTPYFLIENDFTLSFGAIYSQKYYLIICISIFYKINRKHNSMHKRIPFQFSSEKNSCDLRNVYFYNLYEIKSCSIGFSLCPNRSADGPLCVP